MKIHIDHYGAHREIDVRGETPRDLVLDTARELRPITADRLTGTFHFPNGLGSFSVEALCVEFGMWTIISMTRVD